IDPRLAPRAALNSINVHHPARSHSRTGTLITAQARLAMSPLVDACLSARGRSGERSATTAIAHSNRIGDNLADAPSPIQKPASHGRTRVHASTASATRATGSRSQLTVADNNTIGDAARSTGSHGRRGIVRAVAMTVTNAAANKATVVRSVNTRSWVGRWAGPVSGASGSMMSTTMSVATVVTCMTAHVSTGY